MLRYAISAAVLLASISIHAKTPGEVYEQAAKSTVVVQNLDGKGKSQGMGSGVILPDRDVVTNCHVVKGASQIKVRIDNKEYPATLRYSDWDRDVCSLGVPGISAPAVVMGSSKSLKVGAKVYAIGAPQGLELTLSDGIVSSLREVAGGRYIQTTAAISPGSSGGGLFDENGTLVGLTTFYLAEGQNLNFAVPVEWVKELPKRSVKTATAGQTATQWLNKSIELESSRNWPALLEHSHRWTKAQPSSSMAWYSLGVACGQAGQPAKAIEAYQQALRINPEHADAWYNLGNAYDEVGQPAKAIEAFQQALRIDPEYAKAWNGLGFAYGNASQFAKAIEAFQQALRINPEDALAWKKLGIAYRRADQPAKAIEAYQQALRINPEDAEAWYILGIAYAMSGQRGKVLEVYKRLKSLDPSLAEEFFKKVVMP
ncbi:MAG: tetratricopeptide repeat-containing serine protease family protein [Rhodocyclaceae bacterium]|nr:tetratricopeptide repeat-containing serine protease family protein [Rhodocyclaceae bacterium]